MPFRDVDYSQGGEMAILSYNVVFKKNLHICTSGVTCCNLTYSSTCRCRAVNANSAFKNRLLHIAFITQTTSGKIMYIQKNKGFAP